MNVLLINQFFFPYGGTECSVKITSDLLNCKGHKVMHFSTRDKNNFYTQYKNYFLQRVTLDSSKLSKKFLAVRRAICPYESRNALRKLLINEGHIDVAHINMIYFQISPSIIFELKRFKIPVVLTLRDFSLFCASGDCLCDDKVFDKCKKQGLFIPIFRKCVNGSFLRSMGVAMLKFWYTEINKAFKKVDVFTATSRFLLEKNKEFLNQKIYLLPNFVFTNKIIPEFNYKEKSIVYCGRIIGYKGIKTLVEAVKYLDIKLKIIGRGPLESSLKNEIKARKIYNIEFLGFLEEKRLYGEIKKSMFVVVPSEWPEPFSRTTLEAFALGKPVVASRVGGIPELVKDHFSGLIFEPRNYKDLRQKLKFLISNPTLIKDMGMKARKIAEQNYNPNLYYNLLINIYNIAIKKNMLNKKRTLLL